MTEPSPEAAGEIRFAALGDSLTEGVGDPLPDGTWRGWAALLAAGLSIPQRPVRLVNLAQSGALTTEVARDQLAAARALQPQLASVVIGGNDTLRSAFDIDRTATALDAILHSLTCDGATVLTACLPDPGQLLRLPHLLARPLARRIEAVNGVIHQLSRRYDAVHAHLAQHPMTTDRRAWSVDRLHPNELGYREVARQFHVLLMTRGFAVGDPPDPRPDQAPPTRASCAWWLATKGTRWVVKRSRDLLPGLVHLAVLEARHRIAGTEALLDQAMREDTPAALPTADNGLAQG